MSDALTARMESEQSGEGASLAVVGGGLPQNYSVELESAALKAALDSPNVNAPVDVLARSSCPALRTT